VACITNVVNGTSVVIRINDRGPYVNGRILDLSYAAAKQLGMLQERIALLVRLVEQSKGNEPTHRYLSTELKSLKGELRSVEHLLSESQ
jgi:rare lipoprotein A